MIKRAHFIWYQGPPPPKYLEVIRDFNLKNPDFTIHIWQQTTLEKLLKYSPDIFKKSIEQCQYMIQKIDIYKYAVLWQYGGIYLDLDISIHRPFDDNFFSMMVDVEVVFSKMRIYSLLPFWVINNGIIIANTKNSNVFLDIISIIPWEKAAFKNKDWAILETTGPFQLSRTLKANKRTLILDEEYLEGRPLVPWFRNTNGIYITHLHHSNWMDSWVYLWILCLKYISIILFFTSSYYFLYGFYK